MSDRATELRARFDRGFAEPPTARATETFDYLKIRVGGAPFVVALAEIASLHADLRVVPLPSPARELLGIAAVRATLVPIYDLRIAIGAADGSSPRWTVLVRDAGFAFDGFDGHARTDTRPAAESGGVRPLVTLAGQAYPLIGLGSLLATIQKRWTKESR